MVTRKHLCTCIVLFLSLGVIFTDPASAVVLGPGMSAMNGVVTAIDLKDNTVTISGKAFTIKDNTMVLKQFQTRKIRESDEVKVIYRESNGQNILLSIELHQIIIY